MKKIKKILASATAAILAGTSLLSSMTITNALDEDTNITQSDIEEMTKDMYTLDQLFAMSDEEFASLRLEYDDDRYITGQDIIDILLGQCTNDKTNYDLSAIAYMIGLSGIIECECYYNWKDYKEGITEAVLNYLLEDTVNYTIESPSFDLNRYDGWISNWDPCLTIYLPDYDICRYKRNENDEYVINEELTRKKITEAAKCAFCTKQVTPCFYMERRGIDKSVEPPPVTEPVTTTVITTSPAETTVTTVTTTLTTTENKPQTTAPNTTEPATTTTVTTVTEKSSTIVSSTKSSETTATKASTTEPKVTTVTEKSLTTTTNTTTITDLNVIEKGIKDFMEKNEIHSRCGFTSDLKKVYVDYFYDKSKTEIEKFINEKDYDPRLIVFNCATEEGSYEATNKINDFAQKNDLDVCAISVTRVDDKAQKLIGETHIFFYEENKDVKSIIEAFVNENIYDPNIVVYDEYKSESDTDKIANIFEIKRMISDYIKENDLRDRIFFDYTSSQSLPKVVVEIMDYWSGVDKNIDTEKAIRKFVEEKNINENSVEYSILELAPDPVVTTTSPVNTTPLGTTSTTVSSTKPVETTSTNSTTEPNVTTVTEKSSTIVSSTKSSETTATKASTTEPKVTTVTEKSSTIVSSTKSSETTATKASTTEPKVTTGTEKSSTTAPESSGTVVTTTETNVPKVVSGDANGDNSLSVQDCVFIAKALANRKGDTLPESADYNKDGKKNVIDAMEIAKDLARDKNE